MKFQSMAFVLLAIPLFFSLGLTSMKQDNKQKINQGNNGIKVELINQKADQKVDVMIGGKLFQQCLLPIYCGILK